MKGLILATGKTRHFNKQTLHRSVISKDGQAALHRCLALIESFRAIRRIMPLQHAYTFVLVALDEGRSVSEYAELAGTSQAVMTRILFALGSGSRPRQAGSGLVQQMIDPQDGRRTQTFLTVKGEALVREIARSIRSGPQHLIKPRRLTMAEKSARVFERDQWLSRLIAAGRQHLSGHNYSRTMAQSAPIVGRRLLSTNGGAGNKSEMCFSGHDPADTIFLNSSIKRRSGTDR